MKDNFTRVSFERVFNVEKIITIFYMEFSKNFSYEGESHDFWEMVYIDKGEMLCTADKNKFVLKSGEMTFHKPNEFHNLSGDHRSAPNVSILTFECRSRAMNDFEGKIFRLSPEEKTLLATLFEEGLSCFKLVDEKNPLLQKLERIENAPFGSSQMTKNLLEIFLIMLSRNTAVVPKHQRRSFLIDGVDVPYPVKEILDILQDHVYGKLTVGDIAAAVGKSESTVKQLFSQYRKNGIMKYYNGLKIEEAKKLIREGSFNMAQISDLLHFDNPQYFSKCFKAFTHMTPREYKTSILNR
ncbi:MAG: helix-turn-helix transcriptional regulator [Oscillospiraceae bacterium]|nr:helix-turn-helix transcriptional regulator [Oscillospiraceae bacterium]